MYFSVVKEVQNSLKRDQESQLDKWEHLLQRTLICVSGGGGKQGNIWFGTEPASVKSSSQQFGG